MNLKKLPKIFIELKQAYDANDLKKVSEVLDELELEVLELVLVLELEVLVLDEVLELLVFDVVELVLVEVLDVEVEV